MSRKEILVIGGTGAQGLPVVKAISASTSFSARVLTRNSNSARAQELASLPHVSLIQGTQDSQKDLHAGFRGVYGAWVNTDGFTLGEKNEMFYGMRAYEIARGEGVKHYVYAATDYAVRDAGWDEQYHWGHNDAKGRVGEFILAMAKRDKEEGKEEMTTSLITTGPYADMLMDGMFVPEEREDGVFVWRNPARSGKIPLIALSDVGHYSLWLFEHPTESSTLNLRVGTASVSFAEIAETFTRVTGKPAIHEYVPLEAYLTHAEPYPNAPANFAAGPDVARDEASMTWKENFSAWWRFWGEGKCVPRDEKMLDRVLPDRIKGLEEWMREVQYDGRRKSVLKGLEDMKDKSALK
ncbi:hypothetical protein CJF30_00004343 [Rutstroemia sp. NJR-2017a BBW]|nr:hypothetical protein CJF30_00004343 [Rutstroemia sp. NJR-2017a BBW]